MTNEEAKEMLHNVRTETFYRYPAMNEALKLAISALEKQIPKNVEIGLDETGENFTEYYRCPKCYNVDISESDDYCFQCGQHLDWRDTE